jgi:hypothetical protein
MIAYLVTHAEAWPGAADFIDYLRTALDAARIPNFTIDLASNPEQAEAFAVSAVPTIVVRSGSITVLHREGTAPRGAIDLFVQQLAKRLDG